MRLSKIAALVALTTIATAYEAEARSRHRHYHHVTSYAPIEAEPVAVSDEPTFLERLTGRVNVRMNQLERGLDYVATAGRGSVQSIVTQEAARAGVPNRLAHAIIKVESGYNCRARNRSGASGAGQLMPATARAMGVRNIMDCRQNIAGAMRYLRQAINRGGAGCAGDSLYETGVGARPHCSAYGRRVMRFASN
ncbi:lytic transglycosylase domain-containing protein [Methylobacterium sp. WL103]|uniref:lytic transglycosylase domain-containing protein n=1 Tax=Methylobacterium sp. WL103 TaxID=2603891 RepID=UPI0011C926C3|nr:lytic transglycosylase domain-containing protein [Methylobacterium sp. WL103]TXN08944.1 lytic transglycosylase domain-containing protein [Methylobacterium sp. WL103]